ncbi:MAG: hypothetical protein DMG68_13445 [Acidobacteria bacterium]|jgi:hypothetical protein|nr:MAG: hypothetical protein DMG68_13445 [Acidobacteriota bacterium]
MKVRLGKLGIYLAGLLLLISLGLSLGWAGEKKAGDQKDSGKQTLTGVVSDAMCGAKHMMPGDPAGCLRACVSKGSKYALVVGDKVYTLDSSDKAVLDKLDKLADQKAKVTGTLNGDDMQVSSVSGT